VTKVHQNKKHQNRGRRINLTLTEEQAEKLNTYMVNVIKKRGYVVLDLRQKILLRAFDEWFEKHEDDLDIDWNS